MLNTMPNKKCNTLDDINDILIVRKITEKESTSVPSKEAFEEETYESDIERVQHLLAQDQESIIKKQLQLLQADERGKQALISEIAAIKQKQEKRAELLRHRQHALNIEKERAKKIALLPPPLPKSVKSLLRKNEEPKPNKPDVQMPDELKVFHITGVESQTEDKENILDPEELEARQKMQDEWQMKAKKRFNEALKKDRKKEEYSKIMKQIQNSELHNRLEMAKSISSEKKCVPCPLSDKFQSVKKQTDMEDAAEKVFKKMNKEHVIEDIEGYQDYYEEKYKKLDSEFEHKMIDCIPSFVKENYGYLLEDESKFQGGKNFLGLDDTTNDIFNEAYIASPPDSDTLDGREKIDLAINQLDKLRSDLQTEYDQTLKPLLIASLDIPKKELSDKAVETESLKLPIEDKAVGTDMQYDFKITSPPPIIPIWTDFSKSGVMAFKRRHNVPTLGSFSRMHVPDMHKKEVYYTMPPVSQSDIVTPSSWSSSSYCSLPSQHGMPVFPSAADSVKCDICVAERKRDDLLREVPQGTVLPAKEKCDKSETTIGKPQLSKYVQQLAEKYLLAKSVSSQSSKEDLKKSIQGDSSMPLYSDTETVNSAFEREIISKPREFVAAQKSDKFQPIPRKEKVEVHHTMYEDNKKADCLTTIEDKITILNPKETLVEQSNIIKGMQEHICEDIYDRIKQSSSSERPPEYSEYDIEAKRIQLIKQVLSKKIPRFSLDLSSKTEDSFETSNNEKEEEKTSLPGQNIVRVEPHIYHELSTIQEMDSALTASSLQASISKLSDTSATKGGKESLSKKSKDHLDLSGDRLKMASLLDPPDTSVSELAKSIQFIKPQELPVQSQVTPDSGKSESTETASSFSKDTLMPSSLKSDSNLDTPSSVLSTGKMFSSSLIGNVKHPTIKDNKLPKYFMNVSEIPKKVSSLENYSLSPSLFPSEFHSNVFSSPTPGSSLSIPSSVEEKSEKKKDPGHSLISGFIDSVASSGIQSVQHAPETQSKENKDTGHSLISGFIDSVASSGIQSVQHATETQSKENKDTVISGFLDSPFPISTQFTPSGVQPNLEDNNNLPSLISGFISNSEASDTGISRHFRVMTPHSNISSPDSKIDTSRQPSVTSRKKGFVHEKHSNYTKQIESKGEKHTLISGYIDSNSETSDTGISRHFRVMTPHSNISSVPSLISGYIDNCETSDESSSKHFRAMTPHSDISTPGVEKNITKSDTGEKKKFDPSVVDSKLKDTKSNVPSLISGYIDNCETSDESSSKHFRAMTPHSDISTPGVEKNITKSDTGEKKKFDSRKQSIKYGMQSHLQTSSSNSSGEFQVMTPHSFVSSPSERVHFTSKTNYDDYSSSSGTFKALTAMSMVSSPSLPNEEVNLKSKNASSGRSEFQSMNVRFDILTSSVSSNNQSSPIKKLPHLNYHISLKTPVPGYLESFEKPRQNAQSIVQRSDSCEKKIYYISQSHGSKHIQERVSGEIREKESAKVCSSEFFIPQFCATDLPASVEENKLEENVLSGEISVNQPKSTIDPLKASSSKDACYTSEYEEKIPQLKIAIAETGSCSKEVIGKSCASSEKSKESSAEKDIQNFEVIRNVNKYQRQSNLFAGSSTSSSTENLSEISSSKVLYQSTPIKSLEEIAQEPGILEEPDLTLITTEYSCNVDSPEKPRKASNSKIIEVSLNEERDCTVISSENDCRTPTNQSPQSLAFADTPSMLSFLQHEISCAQTDKNPGNINPVTTENPSLASDVSEGKTDCQRSQFPRSEYKQRTKRLWNNLEEVRKKNLAEERRKLMAANRLKAKEYAKRLTPKRK